MSSTTKTKAGATTGAGERAGGYTVLARRYRSRTFDELVGQEPIARTLRNAIRGERTAHAYLFCGTRGVGKTSTARIFARALNVDEAKEPLLQADAIAEAILRGDDLDVVEIDGASNRGIAEARDLIAGAGLSPARCRYRIYIIDEVHMLTREAFNALLKTMEEPPAHVKFILCTTDPQKVPATIRSRCQRFDFRAIPTAAIAQQIGHVLESEGIEADEAVVRRVASLGNGSMRDALSLLDRLLAAGEKKLTLQLAEEMLGLPDRARAATILDAAAAGDPGAALEAGAAMLAAGATVDQALETLAEELRLLLLASACGAGHELVEVPADEQAALAVRAEAFDVARIVHMIAVCDAAARNSRGSAIGRAQFDAALARLALGGRIADAAGLLAGEKKNDPVSAGREAAPRRAPAPATPAPPTPPTPRRQEPEPAAAPAAAPSVAAASEAPAIADAALWPALERHAAADDRDRARLDGYAFEGFDGVTLRLRAEGATPAATKFLVARAEGLVDLVARVTGRKVRIACTAAEGGAETSPEATGGAVAAARELPAVRSAIEIFDAVVTGVADAPSGAGRKA